MPPQHKNTPSDRDAERIRKAVEYQRLAQVELVSAVLDAMKHGASIRETALVAGISERTVIRWRQGMGLPTFDDWRAPALERQRILNEVYGLDKVKELLAELDRRRADLGVE